MDMPRLASSRMMPNSRALRAVCDPRRPKTGRPVQDGFLAAQVCFEQVSGLEEGFLLA
jgi:hypothetical protein